MAIISSTGNQTGVTAPTNLADLTGAKQMGRDDFLKLLVTQLKNQDPLKPMDNTEFVAELAQFSQLDQSTRTVSLLEKSIGNQTASMQFGMLAMIGRTVQVEGAVIQLGTDPATLNYALDRGASSVRISIANQNGQVVRSIDAGSQEAGVQQIQWDGRNQNGALMPAGTYHYSITAVDNRGAAVAAATTSTLKITGVRTEGDQPRLVAGDQVIDQSAILELH